LRETIRGLTLKALQARELYLKQMSNVAANIAKGINSATGTNKEDMNRVLSEAFSGMDDALLKVVEGNKIAIQN